MLVETQTPLWNAERKPVGHLVALVEVHEWFLGHGKGSSIPSLGQ